jgi:SAM-dependent methyltransferase
MTTGAARGSSPQFFERLYQNHSDPWHFAGSAYERGRYAAILHMLGRAHYGSAFEPGCSIGELSVQLAPRCDRLLATDVAPSAVARATQRCQPWPQVRTQVADLQQQIPTDYFDLILLCEIGYYFESTALCHIAQQLAQRLNPGGELLASHWLGHSADHRLHGDDVHGVLHRCLPLRWQRGSREPMFRIDAWER